MPTILIVDDEPSIRQSLRYVFNGKGYEVHEAGTAAAGIRLAKEILPDILLLDYRLPDKTGLEALQAIRSSQPDALAIMMTAYGSIPDAVEAMRLGAIDYLTKPVDISMLEVALERALEIHSLKKENRYLRARQSIDGAELLGRSTSFHRTKLMISALAENHNTTVLIGGESGTGKELAARTIHRDSQRSDKPFVDINCASLSEHILESELFGHERGAFTDAKETKKGLIEVADGGTLFLDEVADLSLSLQPKLLRVLETRTFRRLGGTKDITVDVRVIAATNRDLWGAVLNKEFREDLYYRLCVMPITMPPLRERPEDVLILARHFLERLNTGLRKDIKGLSPECEELLKAYSWPGNVRELRNVMERALILSPGPFISPEHLPKELEGVRPVQTAQPEGRLSLEDMQRQHIIGIMEKAGGNQSQAARMLGISRSTLLNKLKKFGLL